MHVLVFNCALGLVCLIAFLAGGAPERWTAIIFIIGAAATFVAPFYNAQRPYGGLEPMLLAIDVLMLGGLVAIALRADRYWPLYVSALHLIGIAVHGVKAIQPALVPWMYAGASGKIAYPMLVLLAVGAVRHRKRVLRFGSDPDWSQL
ncbi:hypothetical protein [Sphingomonas beigongshangi]|jgi:hypothetical protein|uniref:hypothetical protein n=1 Tax=Sphingomonas beigongshangi TaxID=2782540 RepID=UPI001FEDF8D0|nr:hypothetical protein [Sphingomonas beigongshangi]